MPNFNRGRYNSPLAFFIRPEGPGARHPARIKANANYNLSFDQDANFSVAFFPVAGVAAGQNVGSVRPSDVDGLIRWLEANRGTFIDYYRGAIGYVEFDAELKGSPYS